MEDIDLEVDYDRFYNEESEDYGPTFVTTNLNDITLIGIKDCKYLLLCGKCDKTNLMCSQYER